MRELVSSGRGRLYLLALVVVALLFTIARYPGIEGHSAYFGMTFKTLYPESFPSDMYFAADTPIQLSVYSLLVRAMGSAALDDRAQIVVYLLLVVASLLAVDRLLALFGVPLGLARIGVIGMMLFEHRIVDNIPHLVDATSAFRASSFAQPIGMWLLYVLLSGASTWYAVALVALMALTSVKNAWFPVLACLAVIVRDRAKLNPKRVALIVAAAVLAGLAVIAVVNLSRGASLGQEAQLFDMSLVYEGSEANPFLDGVGWAIYLGIVVACALGSYPRVADRTAIARVRILLWLSAGFYVLAGLYYTFAPDVVKATVLVALAANRSTWLTQNLIQLLLGAYAVLALKETEGRAQWAWAAAVGALLAFPLVDYETLRQIGAGWRLGWNNLHVARFVTFVLFLALFLITARALGKRRRRAWRVTLASMVMYSVVVTVALSFAYKVWSRAPALEFMARHGIVGDNPTAKWIGVNEWVRANTPEDASVLALSGNPPSIDTSLRSRTGRTEFFGNAAAMYFDYPARIRHEQRAAVAMRLEGTLARSDVVGAGSALRGLGTPDYLVFPYRYRIDLARLGYAEVARVGDFTVAESTLSSRSVVP